MNEQLIVKNFGPIKDATVDFKRVTVFIGPTGGGKSTLAKLAAIFNTSFYNRSPNTPSQKEDCFHDYNLSEFMGRNPAVSLKSEKVSKYLLFLEGQIDVRLEDDVDELSFDYKKSQNLVDEARNLLEKLRPDLHDKDRIRIIKDVNDLLDQASVSRNKTLKAEELAFISLPSYIPSDRAFVASISSSFAGLMRDDIGLPKPLLNFANAFFQARDEVYSLEIAFLNVEYFRHDNKDYVSFSSHGKQASLQLNETASGIQSVTPLLVLLEHLSRNTEQAQSFIIEEPELNLYPTAQQGLLNWLVEKCTKGENDLTITTHSPYILSHLNLLLYAHHVGTKDEEKRRKVAAIIPEQYWLNPDEFAAYYVNGPEGVGGVRSLLDPETKLISQNELDAVSGVQADEFDQLLDINRGF